MPDPILAWHFSRGTRLGYNDGRQIRRGRTLVHRGPLVMCYSGLHASRDILDALAYAPGSHLWRVECSGEVIEGRDKLVCSRRRVLWGGDASDLLRAWARWCVLQPIAAGMWEPPDVVLQWLLTGDETLRDAAMEAAMAVAREAARAADWGAAWRAARAAARAADWAADRVVVTAAVNAAYWAAYSAAARSAQRDMLFAMIEEWRDGVYHWEWEIVEEAGDE